MIKVVQFKLTVIALLIIIACIGYGVYNKLTVISKDDITKISVTFNNAEGVSNVVTVDFEKKIKKTIIYGKEKAVSEEFFEVDGAFLDFIEGTVLKHINEGEVAGDNDDMRVVWRIQVLVGDESFQLNGFEEFPVYWDEILMYMGIVGHQSDNNALNNSSKVDIEVESKNRTIIANALSMEEYNGNISVILSCLNTINVGQIQSAEYAEIDGDKVINVVAEDKTNYRIYLSRSGNVEAVQNLDTGEWLIQSTK